MGKPSGRPYVAQLELNTNLRTPAPTAASSNLIPLPTLFPKYLPGLVMDSPTSALAAKCTTTSACDARSELSTAVWSPRSPSTKVARPSTAARCPSERLSNTVTAWPAFNDSSTKTDPMYPAPPVTKTFMSPEGSGPAPFGQLCGRTGSPQPFYNLFDQAHSFLRFGAREVQGRQQSHDLRAGGNCQQPRLMQAVHQLERRSLLAAREGADLFFLRQFQSNDEPEAAHPTQDSRIGPHQ